MKIGLRGFHFGDPSGYKSIKKRSWNPRSVFDALFTDVGPILALWGRAKMDQKGKKHEKNDVILGRRFLDAKNPAVASGGGLVGCAGAGEDFWRGTRTSKTWKKRTWRQELGAKSWAKNWASWVLKFGTPTPEGRRIRQRRIPPAQPSTGHTMHDGRASGEAESTLMPHSDTRYAREAVDPVSSQWFRALWLRTLFYRSSFVWMVRAKRAPTPPTPTGRGTGHGGTGVGSGFRDGSLSCLSSHTSCMAAW